MLLLDCYYQNLNNIATTSHCTVAKFDSIATPPLARVSILFLYVHLTKFTSIRAFYSFWVALKSRKMGSRHRDRSRDRRRDRSRDKDRSRDRDRRRRSSRDRDRHRDSHRERRDRDRGSRGRDKNRDRLPSPPRIEEIVQTAEHDGNKLLAETLATLAASRNYATFMAAQNGENSNDSMGEIVEVSGGLPKWNGTRYYSLFRRSKTTTDKLP